ncbi:hypothetical protein CRG98_007655 [Punica granatum]|uniref:Uncharacterized protein n=1 Tax=Punica granatum TaxID=22663 RepID=A0A2I0KU20_PUNGR|nr:hypothetical protein CRG98_007655 [Punica granatum]
MGPFSRSGSTREAKMGSEAQSDSCSMVKGCFCDACSSASGRLRDPWRVFILVMRMGSCFQRPRCEVSGAHVGHAWAYRDVLKDAQVVLSVVRRARRLGPFSSGCRRAVAFVTRMGDFYANFLSRVREPIGDCVGVDNLAISLEEPWSAQCAKAQDDCFVYISFYSHFATITRLRAVPLNLKGMSSPFTMAAHKGFPVVPLFCTNFCLGRPEKGFST